MTKKEPIKSPYHKEEIIQKIDISKEVIALTEKVHAKACIVVFISSEIPCKDGKRCLGHQHSVFAHNVAADALAAVLEGTGHDMHEKDENNDEHDA